MKKIDVYEMVNYSVWTSTFFYAAIFVDIEIAAFHPFILNEFLNFCQYTRSKEIRH